MHKAQAGKLKLLINRINLGEIFYITARRKGRQIARAILKEFSLLPVEVISASDALGVCRTLGFVAATALEFQAEILTGDKDFQHLEKLIRIIWL